MTPVLLAGTLSGFGLTFINPCLEKGVASVACAIGKNLPVRPIQWPARTTSLRLFAASYLYALYMFGLGGFSRDDREHSFPELFVKGGLVGLSSHLKREFGMFADPVIWLSDYLSNIFLFSPLVARALRVPVRGFLVSGALVYWAPVLGTARMTSVWAPQGKETSIAVGRATIFILANSALALKANKIISAGATNKVQIGISLVLSAATYLVTSH